MTSDVIIVGAGHNGLVAAFYLARAGLKPLVLERRSSAGGTTCTGEFHPGFRCSTLAHAGAAIRPAIARDMQLEQHGFRLVRPDPFVFAPSPDGTALALYGDQGQAQGGLSRHDAERYVGFHGALQRLGRFIDPLISRTPPSVDRPGPDGLWSLIGAGRSFRALGHDDAYRLLRWAPMPAADLMEEWFESDLLRATIAAPGLLGAFAGPRSAGTSATLLLHATLHGHPGGSGEFVVGGMGSLTNALASAATAAGARIQTDAEVARIEVKGGTAVGVTLATGQTLTARAVVSNADPHRTLAGLVDPEELDPEFLVKIGNYRCRGVTAKVNLALSGLPEFPTLRAVGGSGNREDDARKFLSGRIHIGPGIDYLERAFDAAKYGEYSEQPSLDVTIPTLSDPSLAPAGCHVMSVCAQYAPYVLKDGDWSQRGEEFGDRVVATLAGYAPNLPRLVVAGQVITPVDLERDYGLTGGHIYHGEPAMDQLFAMRPLFGWAQYRTPILGLYLCGAGTHPGVGISGASGANASREVVRDLRRGRG